MGTPCSSDGVEYTVSSPQSDFISLNRFDKILRSRRCQMNISLDVEDACWG